MKKLLALLVGLTALAACASAAAHPLGNFTINRYSRIEPSGNRIYVLYVLDMAEIPTFQAASTVRAEGESRYSASLARSIARGLELVVGGRQVPLRPLRRVLAFPPGQAGLHTTRLETLLESGPLPSSRSLALRYRDRNFANRIGWKEIVVEPGANARVLASTAPSHSISQELLAYPKNLLQSPLDVTEASARIVAGSGQAVAPTLLPRSELERRVGVRAVADGGFAKIGRAHV